MPAILVEVCFVDSSADVGIYNAKFDTICTDIADILAPGSEVPQPIPPQPDEQAVTVAITAPAGVDVTVTVNGEKRS
jgi:hypothetical protein